MFEAIEKNGVALEKRICRASRDVGWIANISDCRG